MWRAGIRCRAGLLPPDQISWKKGERTAEPAQLGGSLGKREEKALSHK